MNKLVFLLVSIMGVILGVVISQGPSNEQCYSYLRAPGEYYPTKIIKELKYGYIVKTRISQFDKVIEDREDYVLKDDFYKFYRPSDCFGWE